MTAVPQKKRKSKSVLVEHDLAYMSAMEQVRTLQDDVSEAPTQHRRTHEGDTYKQLGIERDGIVASGTFCTIRCVHEYGEENTGRDEKRGQHLRPSVRIAENDSTHNHLKYEPSILQYQT